MNGSTQKKVIDGLLTMMQDGAISIPTFFLKYYHRLPLTETEAMLIIQLILFQKVEGNDFPTYDEIQARMNVSEETIIELMQGLMNRDFIAVEAVTDIETGMICGERYNITPIYEKVIDCWLADQHLADTDEQKERQKFTSNDGIDVFSTFEHEFGRPLSPMECETIIQWLETDRYEVPLIYAALKEAVFAGKVHLNYIDRILLEWGRNKISTVEQAREFSQRFRGQRN